MIAREQLPGAFFAENRVENAAEGLGELVIEVIFRVDRDVVFEHIDGVFGALVVLRAAGALDDNIGDTVAQGRRGASVALLHAFSELHMRLLGTVVFLRKSFGDDEFGHVDFILKQVGDDVFDIPWEGLAGVMGWMRVGLLLSAF